MIILISILRLPATILHELTHLVMAILTFSSITGFSLIPKIQKNRVVLGNVSVIPKFRGALILIGLSPLILLIIAFFIYKYQIIIWNDWITYLILLYLVIGGIPSTQDLKSVSDGLFSISGIMLLIFITILIKIIRG